MLCYDSRETVFASSVYGRLATEEADTWAQFWFWYARDWSPLPWRRGHPGDWEMVQYLVGSERAAFAQHSRGQLGAAQRNVYVALGRHACYFTPGWHHHGLVDFDRADGKGKRVEPVLQPADEYGWLDGPFPPGRHRQWRYPSAWASSLATDGSVASVNAKDRNQTGKRG